MRMNVNLYLPDELGQRAKAADLPLSRLLQAAVSNELERRAAVSNTLQDIQTYEVEIEDRNGYTYTGRITGTCIAESGDVSVYLTEDGRVIGHNASRLEHRVFDDPETSLREALWPGAYQEAMSALGIKAVIDL